MMLINKIIIVCTRLVMGISECFGVSKEILFSKYVLHVRALLYVLSSNDFLFRCGVENVLSNIPS